MDRCAESSEPTLTLLCVLAHLLSPVRFVITAPPIWLASPRCRKSSLTLQDAPPFDRWCRQALQQSRQAQYMSTIKTGGRAIYYVCMYEVSCWLHSRRGNHICDSKGGCGNHRPSVWCLVVMLATNTRRPYYFHHHRMNLHKLSRKTATGKAAKRFIT